MQEILEIPEVKSGQHRILGLSAGTVLTVYVGKYQVKFVGLVSIHATDLTHRWIRLYDRAFWYFCIVLLTIAYL